MHEGKDMLECYVVLDLEMTGLNPKKDRIIEIGAARIKQGMVVEEYETFVNPGIKIPDKVTQITGITDDMVKSAPGITGLLTELFAFLGEDVLLGHNLIFDYSFLKQAAINEKLSFEKRGVDTLKIARKALPNLEHRTLEYLCGYYGIARENGHRALCDAIATAQLFERLREEYETEFNEVFQPGKLNYKAKRQTAATKNQLQRLKELIDYHKISIDVDVEHLSRSEASRLTDKILSTHGKIQS